MSPEQQKAEEPPLEDEKIAICLCEETWGDKVETLTCQEFINHSRKLYNAYLEKKRVIESHVHVVKASGNQQIPQANAAAFKIMNHVDSEGVDDARTRSSTD